MLLEFALEHGLPTVSTSHQHINRDSRKRIPECHFSNRKCYPWRRCWGDWRWVSLSTTKTLSSRPPLLSLSDLLSAKFSTRGLSPDARPKAAPTHRLLANSRLLFIFVFLAFGVCELHSDNHRHRLQPWPPSREYFDSRQLNWSNCSQSRLLQDLQGPSSS